MTEVADPVTVALTGHLPFYFVLAAIITWPTALGLLSLYTRSVRQSMRRAASSSTYAMRAQAVETTANTEHPGETGRRAVLYDLPVTTTPDADALLWRLVARPRRAALAYSIGGIAYGLVLAVAQLLADGLEFRPIRFLFLFYRLESITRRHVRQLMRSLASAAAPMEATTSILEPVC